MLAERSAWCSQGSVRYARWPTQLLGPSRAWCCWCRSCRTAPGTDSPCAPACCSTVCPRGRRARRRGARVRVDRGHHLGGGASQSVTVVEPVAGGAARDDTTRQLADPGLRRAGKANGTAAGTSGSSRHRRSPRRSPPHSPAAPSATQQPCSHCGCTSRRSACSWPNSSGPVGPSSTPTTTTQPCSEPWATVTRRTRTSASRVAGSPGDAVLAVGPRR